MSVETLSIDGYAIHHANDTFVDDVSGLGAPEPRVVRAPAPRRHGAVDATQLYGPRVLALRGWCGEVPSSGNGPAAAVSAYDALKQVLSVETSHLLVLRRHGRAVDEQCVVRIASDVDDETLAGGEVIRWGCELVAPDPRLYETTLNTQQRTGTGSVVVNNAGNIATPAFVQIEGATNLGGLFITNETLDQMVQLTSVPALLAGETLDVDTGERTVMHDGDWSPGLVTPSTSDWWLLTPGSNTITVTGSALQAGTTIRVRWRNARI